MELVKELPAIFEEFSEQRKNSFIPMYELKQKGVPVVGGFCTYLPKEIPMAMGAVMVGLCSKTGETIPDAEQDLPRNLCPLIKSSYGFAKTDKCPFFYFSDLIVGETTCDGKKKMYEMLAEFKNVHVLELPNKKSEMGTQLFKEEIKRFKCVLEEQFDTTITEDDIRKSIHIVNEQRKALKEFYGLQKMDPPPMGGMEMHKVLDGVQFRFDMPKATADVRALTQKIKDEYDPKKYEGRKRILLTGSPIGCSTAKVVGAIEENGGVVVCYENCGGARSVDELVDETNPDVYEALAKRYINIPCSCMSPNPGRLDLFDRLLEEYKIDGVIEVVLQACHTFNVESYKIKKHVTEKHNIPYMYMETDYSSTDAGQVNTRVAAFIEML
ncbi:MAG: 2-hydroxyacyl-CoA dehydratase [Clostridia bacterium]|nr:2-hydroxyacyl-CoA dehydratase [Clostridia bacterium]MBQ3062455.1 2-hydroxyacyl-CoA dehydratase [Clostridia bacterium]MBQ9966300.1 2-hydroxyacyl-CoA dehydratase [Clostridia bacterium]